MLWPMEASLTSWIRRLALSTLSPYEKAAALVVMAQGEAVEGGWALVLPQKVMAEFVGKPYRSFRRTMAGFSLLRFNAVHTSTGTSCQWHLGRSALECADQRGLPAERRTPLGGVADLATGGMANAITPPGGMANTITGGMANVITGGMANAITPPGGMANTITGGVADLATPPGGCDHSDHTPIYEERAPACARSSSSSNKHTDQDLLGAEDGGQGGSAPNGLIPSHSERSIPRASASALDWLSVPSAEMEAWDLQRKKATLEELMVYVGLPPSAWGVQRDAWLLEALRPSGRPLKAFLWSIHTAAARGAFQPVDGALETRDGKRLLGSVGRFLRNTTPEEYDNKAPAAQAAGGGYRGGRAKLPNSSIRETWNQPPNIYEGELEWDGGEVDLEGM